MLRKILCACLGAMTVFPLWAERNVVEYVNPIIGTNSMGHTFPGACVPFGLIQLSPDTDTIPHNVNGEYGDYQLNTVFAAYMNYNKADNRGEFNTPGILLTDAVMFALGGSE